MTARWVFRGGADASMPAATLDGLEARCLAHRGVTDPTGIAAFLQPALRALGDPFDLTGMRAAVTRLLEARERAEMVVLFCDYDVDGVTSTALLAELLGEAGWRVGWYLPDRFDEGYGLTRAAAEAVLGTHRPDLLLAVDCGSTSVETIGWLRSQGVGVVVLDHHQVAGELPPTDALVNPHLGGPGRELCTAGVAFKLAHALVKAGREAGDSRLAGVDVRPYLDLVALGTVADLVPLVGENRILVHAGLSRLADTRRPGLRALMDVAGVRPPLSPGSIGFQLGPRLNAAGRLETAAAALELVLARDPGTARELAGRLDAVNRERQEIERRIVDAVLDRVRSRFDPDRDYVIVEGSDDWHIGVVGIVASRVLREFHRPTLILGADGAGWRGSGRSIPGFDLAAALREVSDLLDRHGGHAMAAGVSLAPGRVDALRARLNEVARARLTPEQLRPEVNLDARVPLGLLDAGAVTRLERLGPFGQGNPPVHVAVDGLRLSRPPRRLGREQQHWKLHVTDGACEWECVWWGAGTRPAPEGRFDLAVAQQLNEYQGEVRVQLRVLDWRPSGATDPA